MGTSIPVGNTIRSVDLPRADRFNKEDQLIEVILQKPDNTLVPAALTIPETVVIPSEKVEPEASRFETLQNAAIKRYDQASLAIKPRLADARIVIGVLAILTGMAGLITLFSGINLPLAQFLKKYSTLSVTVSLMMIQTGISSIHTGVSYKDTELQLQQEAQRARAIYEIERSDINPAKSDPIHTRAEVESLESTLPNLTPPGEKDGTAEINPAEKQAIIESKWSAWWRKRLPLLGKMQIANGGLMLGVGLIAFTFMFNPHIPPGLSVIGQDPALSIAFSFVLMANWINSAVEGWNMIGYEGHKQKRAKEVDQLQLVDEGLKLLKEFELEEKEKEALQAHLADFKGRIHRTLQVRNHTIEEVGGPSRLATPSILLGIATIVLAGVFLTMTYTGHVPKSLSILTKNTPLSTLFAGTLLISGISSIQVGAATSEQAHRRAETDLAAEYREALLDRFAQYEPLLPLPAAGKEQKGKTRILTTLNLHRLPQNIKERESLKNSLERVYEKRPNAFQRLWLEAMQGLWVPQALWGTLLLAAGIGGITFALGAPIPSAFRALAGHQAYTLAQSISLLGAAFLALNTSYSMGIYRRNREQERAEIELMRQAYQRLLDTPSRTQLNLRA